eukprot:9038449-Lingulodinium_polyedra.AAC.1
MDFKNCPFETGCARELLEQGFLPKDHWRLPGGTIGQSASASGTAHAAPASSASAGGRGRHG